MPDSLWPYGLQHARLPCPSPTFGACSNSCPLSHWCHTTISSSVVPFSSCLQSFPASGSFPISQFLASGGQSIRASASVSVLPMYIQGGFPLRLTGLISCCSRDAQKSFRAPQFKRISSLRFCLLYGPTLTLCMTPGKTIALTILWLCRQRVYNHKSSKRVTPFWLFCQDGLRRINSSF